MALCTHWNHKLFIVFEASTLTAKFSADIPGYDCYGEMVDSSTFIVAHNYEMTY